LDDTRTWVVATRENGEVNKETKKKKQKKARTKTE
jgi:hypothetical protein